MCRKESVGLDIRKVNGIYTLFGRGSCTDVDIFIPQHVQKINEGAFHRDGNLHFIDCANVEIIGSYAFANSGLQYFSSMKMHDVGLHIFENCKILAASVPCGYSILL